MEDLTRTLTVPETTTEKLPTLPSGARRTEITIERETYSIEIHGLPPTGPETRCPACGHAVPVPRTSFEAMTGDQESIAKIILAKARSSP